MISFEDIFKGIHIYRPEGCAYNIITLHGVTIHHDTKNHKIVDIIDTNGNKQNEGEYFNCDDTYAFNVLLLEDEPIIEVGVTSKKRNVDGGTIHIQFYMKKLYRLYCPLLLSVTDRPVPRDHYNVTTSLRWGNTKYYHEFLRQHREGEDEDTSV